MNKKTFILLTLLSLSLFFFGQEKEDSDIISGIVIDITNGEPLPYVSIVVKGSTMGTSSNVDGYFTLHGVSDNTKEVTFHYIGYQTFSFDVSSDVNKNNLVIKMTPSLTQLAEVTITGNADDNSFRLNREVGMIKMSPSKIVTMPNVGEKDIFRAFQLMPGVSAGNEQSSGLYVRGGTPDQNLVLFDGFTVYNVEHLFGFFSAFNVNAIKDVQLCKGGFDARYGSRTSSLVNITGKEGNKNNFNAGVDISLLSFNAFVEAPLGNKMSGIVTYRRSFKSPLYDELQDHTTVDNINPQTEEGQRVKNRILGQSSIRSYFDDLNAKLTYRPSEKDIFSLSYYYGKDNLENGISSQGNRFSRFSFRSEDTEKWGNTGGSIKWNRRWNSNLISNVLAGYSDYFRNGETLSNISITDDDGVKRTSGMKMIEDNTLKEYLMKVDFEWKPNSLHETGFGFHGFYNEIAYRYTRNDTITMIDRESKGSLFAFYMQDRLSLVHNKLVITPGIRTSWNKTTSDFYLEPRMSGSFLLTERIKLKGSAGQYHQFAKQIVRENVLQGNSEFWMLADNDKIPVESAQQFSVGFAWENNDFLIDIEGYRKKMSGLSEYSLRFNSDGNKLNYNNLFYAGSGYAQGVDFLAQKKFGKYTGWIGYTMGVVKQNFPVYGENDFFASNDIRNEFKIVQSYQWKSFDFSASWMYLSGKPYTAPTGGYQLTLPDGSYKDFMIISDKNALRLPDYHRLDISVTYNFGKPGKIHGAIGLSLFNLYDQKNIWYKDFQIVENEIIETDVLHLGFMPNLSFTLKLK